MFMLAGLFAADRDREAASALRWPTSWLAFTRNAGTIIQHPITTLMANAKDAFTNLMRQSKTLPEVVAEYKRRYGRDPQRVFGQWWKFGEKKRPSQVGSTCRPIWEIPIFTDAS